MTIQILIGDVRERLKDLADESVHCIVTSPPYFGLRDYGIDGQIGLEQSPDAYIAGLVEVFRECRRVLKRDGTLWLNLGDSYSANYGQGGKGNTGAAGSVDKRAAARAEGLKPKDLMMIPARVALALQADGWYLRSDIIWHKPNPMPESVKDRPTSAHEHVFLFAKSEKYHYDAAAVAEPTAYQVPSDRKVSNAYSEQSGRDDGGKHRSGGFVTGATRNLRNVWTITPKPFKGAHFAVFPPALVEPCIKAGCPEGGTVLDPFGGSGTTGLVAHQLGRNAILVELNPGYVEIAITRLPAEALLEAAE